MIQASSSALISGVFATSGSATVNAIVLKARMNTGSTEISLVQATHAIILVGIVGCNII